MIGAPPLRIPFTLEICGRIAAPETIFGHAGLSFTRKKMFRNEKLTIPEELVEELLLEHHRVANQPGVDRLVADL